MNTTKEETRGGNPGLISDIPEQETNMTIVQNAPIAQKPRRRKPTEGAAAIQAAREDAGLTREELARRRTLIERQRGLFREISLDEAVEIETGWLKSIERSHVREPRTAESATLLALVDAGPSGTTDEDVLTYWSAFVDECRLIEIESLEETAKKFVLSMIRSTGDIESSEAILKRFFDHTLEEGIKRWTDDPRYLRDSRDIVLRAALAQFAAVK